MKSLQHPVKTDFLGKSGGLPDQRTVQGTTRSPSRPSKATAKPSMVTGPFGGKKPA